MILSIWNQLVSADDDDLTEIEEDFCVKTFYKYEMKRMEYVNLIINISLATVFVFILGLKLWQLLLILVGLDVIFTIINSLIVNHIEKKYEAIRNGHKAEKYLKIFKNRIRTIDDKCKNCNTYNYYDKKDLENKKKILTAIIEKIERQLEEVVIKDVVSKNKTNKQKEAIASYKETLEDLRGRTLLHLLPKYQQIIKESLNISNSLLEEVEKNPSSYRLVKNTFEIYLIELISTIDSVGNLNEEFKQEYDEKLQYLIDEYYNHVKILYDKVKKYNISMVDINIQTLMDEMKKDNTGSE